MDGNTSLKRARLAPSRNIGDQRMFENSDYFLPTAYIETFAQEVRARPVGTETRGDSPDSEDENTSEHEDKNVSCASSKTFGT